MSLSKSPCFLVTFDEHWKDPERLDCACIAIRATDEQALLQYFAKEYPDAVPLNVIRSSKDLGTMSPDEIQEAMRIPVVSYSHMLVTNGTGMIH